MYIFSAGVTMSVHCDS